MNKKFINILAKIGDGETESATIKFQIFENNNFAISYRTKRMTKQMPTMVLTTKSKVFGKAVFYIDKDNYMIEDTITDILNELSTSEKNKKIISDFVCYMFLKYGISIKYDEKESK